MNFSRKTEKALKWNDSDSSWKHFLSVPDSFIDMLGIGTRTCIN